MKLKHNNREIDRFSLTKRSLIGKVQYVSAVAAAATLALGPAACGSSGNSETTAMSADPSTRQFQVDLTKIVGQLRQMNGVNGVPESQADGKNVADASPGYKAANIRLIRTHDMFGAGDIDSDFGSPPPGTPTRPVSYNLEDIFPNMSADPESATSYNWGPTDALVSKILSLGAQPIFRIGRSVGASPAVPPDFAKYGDIAKHIVMHYNKGWSNGMQAGIRYWEVWNEPDLANQFWGGTAAQYYALYDSVSVGIKAADSQALVGGPPLANPLTVSGFRDGFFEHVKSAGVPFDFQPFHYYDVDDSDPWAFNNVGAILRATLDAYGFQSIPMILDEWGGPEIFGSTVSNLKLGSFLTTSLIAMQDSAIQQAAYYRADTRFGADGNTPDGIAQGLILHGMMADTPNRLSLQGSDGIGFAALAGQSSDGKTTQILMGNYERQPSEMTPRATDVAFAFGVAAVQELPRRTVTYTQNKGYQLTFSGANASAQYKVEHYQVTESSGVQLVKTETLPGSKLVISEALSAPAAELIRITEL